MDETISRSSFMLTLAKWLTQSVVIKPGVSTEVIHTAEKALGILFPEPIRHLYSTCGGTWPLNDFRLRVWSIDELISFNKDRALIVFADIGVMDPFFCFNGRNSNDYSIYMCDKVIADSLEAFFSKYLNDPASIDINEQ